MNWKSCTMADFNIQNRYTDSSDQRVSLTPSNSSLGGGLSGSCLNQPPRHQLDQPYAPQKRKVMSFFALSFTIKNGEGFVWNYGYSDIRWRLSYP